MLPNNSRPCDPKVKPNWWRENEYCKFHQKKGHTMNNCMKFKYEIQDLMDVGKIVVGNHTTNANHKAFKYPLSNYEKGDSSKPKGGAKVNYTYINDDNVINMVESSQSKQCNVIIMKEEQDKSRLTNVVTHAQGKVVFKGVDSSSLEKPSSSGIPTSSHNLVKPPTSRLLVSSTNPGYSIID